jgi:hypothetical protein
MKTWAENMAEYWKVTREEYHDAYKKACETLKEEDIKYANFKADELIRIAKTRFDEYDN